MIPVTLGSRQNDGVAELFRAGRHATFWDFAKDKITDCRDCGYRYSCVDCTAPDVMRAADWPETSASASGSSALQRVPEGPYEVFGIPGERVGAAYPRPPRRHTWHPVA